MDGGERRAVEAVRLLRALVDQTMAERGSKNMEEVAGGTVMPSTADAEAVGLVFDTLRYNAAMGLLLGGLGVDALEPDDETNAQFVNVVGKPERGWAFKITSDGLELLRRTGA
ncbi:MAG: hypothetical protein H0W52_11595 [Rubrobacteraceae bacterium]|jgi:hypothetical protein|nr:hypothetical protein [Rubrobacteraceae bacterium]